MLGGGLWYGLLGLVGTASRGFLLPVAAGCFALCLIWHVRSRSSISFGRRSIQANRALVRGTRGLAYFGALVGIGLLTEVATPLVLAGAFYALAAGLPAGVLYGAGFGLGRSGPALAAVFVARREISHHKVAELIVFRLRQPLRYVALLAALAGAGLAAASALQVV
jgi:hypothetical protein